jgi:hypothetical protein
VRGHRWVATIFVDVETPTAQRAALIGRLTDAADEPCPVCRPLVVWQMTAGCAVIAAGPRAHTFVMTREDPTEPLDRWSRLLLPRRPYRAEDREPEAGRIFRARGRVMLPASGSPPRNSTTDTSGLTSTCLRVKWLHLMAQHDEQRRRCED